jgi:hypothetical protein
MSTASFSAGSGGFVIRGREDAGARSLRSRNLDDEGRVKLS